MVVGKNPSDSLWAVGGTGGTGVLEVQTPRQRRWDQTQGRCKPKHSALVPESLTGTQAPSGNHSTLLFLRTNTPSSFCLLLHTLRATRGFCTAPLCDTGMDCALLLQMGIGLVLICLSVGWILIGISPCLTVLFILWGAHTWSAVPLGCPTPQGPLMILLSDNRSLPFGPNNAPDILNTKSHKEINRGEHCGCLSIPQGEAPAPIN